MLPTIARRIGLNPFAAPKAPAVNVPYFPYTWETNPYVCKRTWPPEFAKLSQKHQFKLERRYRRRAKLAYARPNWHKMVKLAQWGSILFVSVYGILFMELTDGNTPFSGVSSISRIMFYLMHADHCKIRGWYAEQMGSITGARSSNAVDDNSPSAAA